MALSTSLLFQGTLGGRSFEAWELTGDGSETSFNPRLSAVDHVWLQNSDDTGNGSGLRATISSGVVTLSAAITSGKKWWLFLLGSV